MTKGLLLLNLGTPDAPDSRAVKRFLRDFLTDARVIDLPAFIRYPLVYGAILPFRTPKTVKNYQAIWTKDGSPLLRYSLALQANLQEQLGLEWKVALGMRYGNPALSSAWQAVKGCEQVTILPLYPQYSSAATGSSIEKILGLVARENTIPSLRVIAEFHQHPGFINAQAALIKPQLECNDYFLFSYHGLPERQLQKGDCYKTQCYATSEALAKALGLESSQYGTSFQSRLGKTPWIQPYTDAVLPELAKKGIKRLAIACPSFVSDCLETLEEIGIGAKQQWQALGGEHFTLIPCVNASALFVQGLVEIIS
ncbi:MAG: ferrochelatase [Tatlockia sp.]